MDDPDHDDVILWLLPHKGEGFDGAAFATSMPQNQSRFVAAHHDVPNQRHIPREERGGTELPVEYGLLENTDCLAVRFSHGARTSVGVVGGCAANADLAFQDIPGISKYHFAITFDDQNRPIVRDLGSKGGTKVTYNEEKGERLSNFEWSLEGPSIANGKPPILNLTNLVQFKVILPLREYTSPEYIDRVRKFRLGTEDPENLFASLIIQSAQGTRLPSGQQTPSMGCRSRPILYRKKLGKGNYGEVTYVWNLTTREEYVVKRPLAKFIKSRTFGEEMWKKEAEIMRSISHVRTSVSEPSCLLMLTADARDFRNILLRSEMRLSLPIQSWNSSTSPAAPSTATPNCQRLSVRRCSGNYLRLWNISTTEILRLGTVISSLKISSSRGGERTASALSLQTSASPKRRTF